MPIVDESDRGPRDMCRLHGLADYSSMALSFVARLTWASSGGLFDIAIVTINLGTLFVLLLI